MNLLRRLGPLRTGLAISAAAAVSSSSKVPDPPKELSIYDAESQQETEYDFVEEKALLQPYIGVLRRAVWGTIDAIESGGHRVQMHIHAIKAKTAEIIVEEERNALPLLGALSSGYLSLVLFRSRPVLLAFALPAFPLSVIAAYYPRSLTKAYHQVTAPSPSIPAKPEAAQSASGKVSIASTHNDMKQINEQAEPHRNLSHEESHVPITETTTTTPPVVVHDEKNQPEAPVEQKQPEQEITEQQPKELPTIVNHPEQPQQDTLEQPQVEQQVQSTATIVETCADLKNEILIDQSSHIAHTAPELVADHDQARSAAHPDVPKDAEAAVDHVVEVEKPPASVGATSNETAVPAPVVPEAVSEVEAKSVHDSHAVDVIASNTQGVVSISQGVVSTSSDSQGDLGQSNPEDLATYPKRH